MKTMMNLLVLLLFAVLCSLHVEIARARQVNVDVSAPWPRYQASFAAEISEFLAHESPELFWKYTNLLCEAPTADTSGVEGKSHADNEAAGQAALTAGFNAAQSLLPRSLHTLLDTVLGLSVYSPTVQFFHTLADGFSSYADAQGHRDSAANATSGSSSSQHAVCGGRAWAVVYPGGHVACDAAELSALLLAAPAPRSAIGSDSDSSAAVQDVTHGHTADGGAAWDHRWAPAEHAERHVVVYGALGSETFCRLHKRALQAVSAPTSTSASATDADQSADTTAYSVRHAFPGMQPVASGTRLQGFGVFLDIKNMEYKSVNDDSADGKEGEGGGDDATASSGESDLTAASFPAGEETAGVQLAALLQAHPDTDLHDLSALRDELQEQEQLNTRILSGAAAEEGEDEDISHMKLWRMKDLGVQTVHSILSSEDPARHFARLVHSFPTYASRVSRIKAKATENVTAAVQTWHRSGAGQMLPTNCLLINGRHVSIAGNTFNVYDMLHTVRAELDQISRLDTFTSGACALTPDDVRALEAAASSLASGESTAGKLSARVDVSRGAKHVVTFLNNLEKDEQYQQWPRHLKMLLTPSWSLHQIRRNLFTVVAVADALSYEGALLVYQFQMMLNQHYPLRVGLVPVCAASDADSDADTEGAVAESLGNDRLALRADVCALFSIARDKYSGATAGTFLSAIAQATLEKHQRRSQAEGVLAQLQEAHAAGQPTGGQYGSTPEEEIAAIQEMLEELQPQTVRDLQGAYAAAIAAHTDGIRSDAPADLLTALPGAPRTREGFRQEARTALSSPEVLAYSAKYSATAAAYVAARGLPVNSYSLNGIVEKSLDLQQGLMQLLGKEQQLLTQWVSAGKINDKTKSLFTAILTLSNAYPRYHPLLEEADGQIQYVDTHANSGGVMRVLRASFKAGSSFISGAAAGGFYSTTLMSVPAARAGFEALHAAGVWLMGSEQQSASSQAEGDASIPAPAHRLAYFIAVPDATLACFDGRRAREAEEEGACAATEVYRAPYLQVASLLLSLQEHATHAATLPQDVGTIIQTAATVPLSIETIRTEVLPSLASFNALSPEAQAQVSASMAFPTSTNERDSVLFSNLRKLNGLTRLAVGSGLYSAKSSPADILVTYNGRRLTVPVLALDELTKVPAMSEHDFTLLAAVERARIGSSLEAIMTAVSKRSSADSPLSTKQIDEQSDLFLHMHSFSGSFASGTRRFNVDEVLAEVGASVVGYGDDTSVRNEFGEPLKGLPLSFRVLPVYSASEQGDSAHGHLRITYIVDPLSIAGQRAAALLSLIRDQLQLEQQVILVPKLDIASNEFPLQNFYRYVLGGSAAANDVTAGRAAFKDLPRQHTLTVRIDAPESWNIQATVAQQDTDNLHCLSKDDCGDSSADGVASQVTTVGYTLKSILVAGQCFEAPRVVTLFSGGSLPVNGLQLTLRSIGGGGGTAGSVHSDTLVMQNLGYFQLAASAPGLYALTLAEGRGADLFTIDGASTVHVHAVDASSTLPAIQGGKLLAVRSFSDTDSANSNRISVTKRFGMEAQVLLEGGEDDDEALVYSRTGRRPQPADAKKAKGAKKKKKKKGVLSSITSMFGGEEAEAAGQQVATVGDGRIHVFSLATGHMYERLLRIMMLSVTKRSSMPIKFWLFENYLSPKFKEIAAAMAHEYGFEVGYVTYKWPAWLTQQTQKQRIIWGYKILFLDVLFPLGVNKVIYVDADQVVRADLKELWDLDLEGKPYAYTPFCTSREETLGFQFWRQGYWSDHLQGRPYHISALYVVDLANFRRNAVGDQLRAIYDGLARDPNSLANLDQDLPNYAQHQVPIHSLPQEWLWCETWCSDASKTAAKTIDLCNNPLHKEPKLDMARRVISGSLFPESWVELDSEVRALEKANGF